MHARRTHRKRRSASSSGEARSIAHISSHHVPNIALQRPPFLAPLNYFSGISCPLLYNREGWRWDKWQNVGGVRLHDEIVMPRGGWHRQRSQARFLRRHQEDGAKSPPHNHGVPQQIKKVPRHLAYKQDNNSRYGPKLRGWPGCSFCAAFESHGKPVICFFTSPSLLLASAPHL